MISERAAKFEEDALKEKETKTPAKQNARRNGKPPLPGMEGVGDPWKVHLFNTYFMTKLMEMGYEKSKLNKWTKKVSIAPTVPSV
jgi:hypothetical protein